MSSATSKVGGLVEEESSCLQAGHWCAVGESRRWGARRTQAGRRVDLRLWEDVQMTFVMVRDSLYNFV